MTDVPAAQPLSRRERRLLEQSQTAGIPVKNAEPVLTPTPEPVVSDASAPSLQVAEVPLSRRERRRLEEGARPESFHPAQALVTAVSADAVQAATTGSTPEQVSTQTVPIAPLPPVFGAPTTNPDILRGNASPVPDVNETPPLAAPVRLVGDVPTTTSSLILPSTPTIDMTSPLSSTGEVVVTGQITLPSSFAEQGTSPLLDRSADNDEVLDAYVTGEIAAMSKPVRASQAVSTKGDDTDILLVRKARWGVAAVVTVIVAAVLGVAAAGLLVVALMTDVIG